MRRSNTVAPLAVAAVFAAGALAVGARATGLGQAPARARTETRTASHDAAVQTLHVQGNVYLLVTSGANVTVQVGPDGVLVVDTSVASVTDSLVDAIRALSDKPIRYIVNTHAHEDHVGGNEKLAKLGSRIAGGNVGVGAGEGAGVIAHENVLTRMSAPTGSQSPLPFSAWPTDTFFTPEMDLFFNGEAIQVIHEPSAHTDGDSIVFFRRSDVISAGDVLLTTTYPVIDLGRGGNVNGIIAGLNRILDLTIPREKQEGGTYVVPGHGRLCDEADVLEYRDMLTIVRDRVKSLVEKGQTLEQVRAARPTLDYDTRYGATSGPWTTAQFVEAVYKSLKEQSQ